MPLNTHVMTREFREGLTKVYRNALIDAGIAADAASVKPHILGTATVTLTDEQLTQLRAHYGEKLEELTGHSNSGAVEILLPAGEKFLKNNRPTLTPEQREAARSSGTGARLASAEERAKREASRQRMAKLLSERFGIDLSDNKDTPKSEGGADGQSE